MKRSTVAWILSFVFVVLASFVSPAPAAAEDGIDSDGPIVRRKLLYRSTRFELAPQAAFTINDAFRRNIMIGANVGFHLTNEWSLSGTFGFGLLHLNTDLASNVETALNDTELGQISYSQVQWAADLGIYYVPIFGKFSFLKTASKNYDIHIGAGFSAVNEVAHAAIDGGNEDSGELAGIRPGAFAALGFRLFLTDMFSLNAVWKNRFYSRAIVSDGSANPEFSWVPEAGVGLGIFFPGTVKVSR